MNWNTYLASEQQYGRLDMFNEIIPVKYGSFKDNEGVDVIETTTGKRISAVYDGEVKGIRKLNLSNPVFPNIPNKDLMLLNDHLVNPSVNTIIVDGFFGTGKTSSICSHLVSGLVSKKIPSAYISKPHIELGKSYGHLPGDIYEKTIFEFQSFTQYFNRYGQPFLAEKLMGKLPSGTSGKPEEPSLHLLLFEYIRGRDIEDGWVILDESQNTNEKEMASFISRVGDKAKLIILGDSSATQIDRKGNTTENNGLSFAKKVFDGKRYAGIVELQTANHILRGKRVRDLLLSLQGN